MELAIVALLALLSSVCGISLLAVRRRVRRLELLVGSVVEYKTDATAYLYVGPKFGCDHLVWCSSILGWRMDTTVDRWTVVRPIDGDRFTPPKFLVEKRVANEAEMRRILGQRPTVVSSESVTGIDQQ